MTDTGDGDSAASDLPETGAESGDPGDDADGDGTRSPEDCDDSDASIYPGSTETCDGRDEDCDDIVDDGCAPALVGDLGVEAAQVVILGPDTDLGFGASVHAGDIDADGFADVVTRVPRAQTADVLALHGPFPPILQSNLGLDGVVDLSEMDSDSFLWTTQLAVAGGADRAGLVASIYGAKEEDLGALYYVHLLGGLTRDDAEVDLRWRPPGDDAEERWSTGDAALVPEAVGGSLVYTAAWYVTYDSCKYGAWVADAAAPGVFAVPDLARLGATANVGKDCWAVIPSDAGDLDGDGEHELLLADDELMDLYFGPLSTDAEGREADARLGGTWPDDDAYAGAWGAFAYHAADIDGDGRDELMTTMAVGDRSDPTCELVRTVIEAGLPRFDTDSPLLSGGDCSDSGFGAEIVTLDLDGDGHRDISVSDSVASTAASNAGAVYVEYGPFEGARELGEPGGARILGGLEWENLGAALAAGDSNGDGFEDLVVGSDRGNWEDDSGSIWIFLGGSR
ncbi:MAG: FG-GAP repeat protein [Deltaproteobacteria bacterium]|nr:FG-GAP repeat protein [Deltaproteobacteria bacterium]